MAINETRRYPRTARVNELLREIIAQQVSLAEEDDDRLGIVTITAVESEPDLRHATVYFSAFGEDVHEVLNHHRREIQAAIGREVRLKRTPQLNFVVDPSIEAGLKVEKIIQDIHAQEDPSVDAD